MYWIYILAISLSYLPYKWRSRKLMIYPQAPEISLKQLFVIANLSASLSSPFLRIWTKLVSSHKEETHYMSWLMSTNQRNKTSWTVSSMIYLIIHALTIHPSFTLETSCLKTIYKKIRNPLNFHPLLKYLQNRLHSVVHKSKNLRERDEWRLKKNKIFIRNLKRMLTCLKQSEDIWWTIIISLKRLYTLINRLFLKIFHMSWRKERFGCVAARRTLLSS